MAKDPRSCHWPKCENTAYNKLNVPKGKPLYYCESHIWVVRSLREALANGSLIVRVRK